MIYLKVLIYLHTYYSSQSLVLDFYFYQNIVDCHLVILNWSYKHLFILKLVLGWVWKLRVGRIKTRHTYFPPRFGEGWDEGAGRALVLSPIYWLSWLNKYILQLNIFKSSYSSINKTMFTAFLCLLHLLDPCILIRRIILVCVRMFLWDVSKPEIFIFCHLGLQKVGTKLRVSHFTLTLFVDWFWSERNIFQLHLYNYSHSSIDKPLLILSCALCIDCVWIFLSSRMF